ncbi:unnamed protein product [Linum trigynum]|uniref:Uncharacterized protein n=1 Tax=Linum trigynum TaxID=586398 RepID=A0AAV2CGK2_9ROSI
MVLRLEFHSPAPWNRPPFGFDERWLGKDDCGQVVLNAWAAEGTHYQHFKRCADDFKQWAGSMIEAQNHREAEIKHSLETLAQMSRYEEVCDEETSLLNELDALWNDEEIM